MRLISLSLFLSFCASAETYNWIDKSEFSKCGKGMKVYYRSKDCGEDCVVLPEGFNCETHEFVGNKLQVNITKKEQYDQKQKLKREKRQAKTRALEHIRGKDCSTLDEFLSYVCIYLKGHGAYGL